MALLHDVEEETDSCGQQEVHGLIEQFGWKDAPYEQMIAQNSYQYNVGRSWHRPQKGQTVATMADRNRAPEERKRVHQKGGSTAQSRASDSVLWITGTHPKTQGQSKLLYVSHIIRDGNESVKKQPRARFHIFHLTRVPGRRLWSNYRLHINADCCQIQIKTLMTLKPAWWEEGCSQEIRDDDVKLSTHTHTQTLYTYAETLMHWD